MGDANRMTAGRFHEPWRWAVTLAGLAIYWLGLRVRLPGVDADAASLAYPADFGRLSIFCLGVRPILYALAVVEMARLAIPPLARWAAASSVNSGRLWRGARILAFAMAGVQALAVATALETPGDVVASPGPMFRLGVVGTVVGATAFLVWLAGVMTERGVGDGLLILFAAPFVAHLPAAAGDAAGLVKSGDASAWAAGSLVALVLAAVLVLVVRVWRAGGRRAVDIWPPVLGAIVLQALTTAYLVVGSPLDDLPAAVWFLVLMAALGGLIWLFAVWRGRASGADAPPLAAEIVVCLGALALALVSDIGDLMTGPWLVLCVAAGLSVASGDAQQTGGLSGPTPTG